MTPESVLRMKHLHEDLCAQENKSLTDAERSFIDTLKQVRKLTTLVLIDMVWIELWEFGWYSRWGEPAISALLHQLERPVKLSPDDASRRSQVHTQCLSAATWFHVCLSMTEKLMHCCGL